MGVVNVTDDSFSDAGLFLDRDRAVEHGVALAADGAAIIDVGGESTRPGASRVEPRIETERIVPVVKDLAAQGVTVSIDTTRAEVAAAALAHGARMVNDVSGGRADPKMAALVADAGVPWVLMHWRSAGPARLIVDPGLGFAKTAQHNWALLRALPELVGSGIPVLVGASRKRFLGSLLADARGERPPGGRETATAVVSALAALQGAWGVRVHDVRATVDALKVVQAWTPGFRCD